MNKPKVLFYFINLDERGEFYADIRDENDNSLVEIDTEYAEFLSDEGVVLKGHGALTSIWNYFRTIGDIPYNSVLTKGN